MTLSRTFIPNGENATEITVDRVALVEETSRRVEQMVQSEQFSAIGKMAASIVHDFKGPLTIIRGCAELLADPEIDAEKRQKYSNMILEDVDRFLRMTHDLLDYSRGAANLDRQPVQLGIWLETLTEYIRQGLGAPNIRLNTHFHFTGEVEMDEARVRRAVMNIVAGM